jgi:hypothetical protein
MVLLVPRLRAGWSGHGGFAGYLPASGGTLLAWLSSTLVALCLLLQAFPVTPEVEKALDASSALPARMLTLLCCLPARPSACCPQDDFRGYALPCKT